MLKTLEKPTKKGRKQEEAEIKAPETLEEGTKEIVRSATVKKESMISAPEFSILHITIKNAEASPLVVHAFSEKARGVMRQRQEAGSTGKKKRQHEARDFNESFQNARHLSTEGWDGHAAAAIRSSMISACRLVGFKMTLSRLSVFIMPDGVDRSDGTPLFRIYGEPSYSELPVRNATGVADIRARPRFDAWHANLRVRFDSHMFTAEDVVNLLVRAGAQCGIGEGRPDSKNSNGLGWGLFDIDTTKPITLEKIEAPQIQLHTN